MVSEAGSTTYQWSPPEKFPFRKPEEWTKCIRRFERFRQASGLNSKSEESQVNALIYAMGEEADDIFYSFHLSEEDSKKYGTVKTNFERYFIKKRNVIYERSMFNRRVQKPDESVDSFITDLHRLAEFCEYGDLHDQLIRDRIVVGLRDAKVSEKLQTDSELTLEKAVILARQNEAIKQQQLNLRDSSSSQLGATNSVNIDAIKKTYRQRPQPRTSQPQMANNSVCSRCGKSPSHSKDRCPAREATCRKCNKKGHFRVVCRSKVPRTAVGEIEEEDDAFLGAIADTDSSEPWTVTLFLNDRQLLFKIDMSLLFQKPHISSLEMDRFTRQPES